MALSSFVRKVKSFLFVLSIMNTECFHPENYNWLIKQQLEAPKDPEPRAPVHSGEASDADLGAFSG